MARPRSLTTVTLLVWVLVGVGAAGSVVSVLLADDLAGPRILLPDGTEPRASYAPVVVVMVIVVASLALVLLEFVRGGHLWARNTLAAILGLVVLGLVAVLATVPPVLLVLVGVVGLALTVCAIGVLFHPDTTAFLQDPTP